MNINSSTLLEESIRPSKTVVFFTHDYFRMVMDKNTQLKLTSGKQFKLIIDICKAYNIEKLVVVSPIEFDNYYTAGGVVSDPMKEFSEARDYVMKIFPKTVFLRSNLVYGSESYFIRFIIQNWINDREIFEGEKYKNFRFSPM